MAFKNQTNFTAKIDGVDIYGIKSKLDYKVNELDERMDVVQEALDYGDIFYQEYFDKYCNTNITADDVLLSESNVVQSLESMANYILAKDPEYNKTESSYFVREDRMTDKMDKEDEFNRTDSSLIEGRNEGVYEEPVNTSNFKKQKKQMIKPEDMRRNDELGEVLRDYGAFLDLIQTYTKRNNVVGGKRVQHLPGKKADLYVYTKHQSAVKDDMKICKDSMMKTHGYNLRYFSESTQPDYSKIDMTNKEHLLGSWIEYTDDRVRSNGLLSFTATNDYQDDFNCILIDVENLINKCELTDVEAWVLELYKKGIKENSIAKDLGVHNMTIARTLDKIADKVIEQAKIQNKTI